MPLFAGPGILFRCSRLVQHLVSVVSHNIQEKHGQYENKMISLQLHKNVLYTVEIRTTNRHLPSEALSGEMHRVKLLDLSIVEEQPAIVMLVFTIPDERVVMTAVSSSSVNRYAY